MYTAEEYLVKFNDDTAQRPNINYEEVLKNSEYFLSPLATPSPLPYF